MLAPPYRFPQTLPPLQIRAEFMLAQLDCLPGVLGKGASRRMVAVFLAAVVGHEFLGDGVDDAVGAAEVVDPDADLLEAVGFGAVVSVPVYVSGWYWTGCQSEVSGMLIERGRRDVIYLCDYLSEALRLPFRQLASYLIIWTSSVAALREEPTSQLWTVCPESLLQSEHACERCTLGSLRLVGLEI